MTKPTIAYFISLDSIHCKKWVKHLSKSHSCIIITYQGMAAADPELLGVKIYNFFPKKFPVKNFILRWFTIWSIGKVLKQNKINIIHSMYCYPNAVWAGYFKFCKKIITTRGSDVLVDYKNIKGSANPSLIYLKDKLEEAFKESTFITCTSGLQKKYLIEQNLDASKISVIRTGIEPEHFTLKPSDHSPEKEFRILSPRSVQNNYNIRNMLEALKLILISHPEMKIRLDQVLFNINSDHLEFLKKFIQEKNLKDHVAFIPPYDLRSVSAIYSNYDLTIMLPASDGTPVSAMEAMINKKPLLISNLPYDEDLINQNYCWFVDPMDPVQIADQILKIKNEKQNNIDQKLNDAYKNVINNANTHNEMKKVTDLYNSIPS